MCLCFAFCPSYASFDWLQFAPALAVRCDRNTIEDGTRIQMGCNNPGFDGTRIEARQNGLATRLKDDLMQDRAVSGHRNDATVQEVLAMTGERTHEDRMISRSGFELSNLGAVRRARWYSVWR